MSIFAFTVKSRSLVSTQKTEYRPQASMNIDRDSLINDLRKALPNACVFKGMLELFSLI